MADLALVVFLVLMALAFDFINGFHDAANSIATVVSTRVLKPQHAVLWAAFFNFIAAFFFETKVASTIGKGVVDPGAITLARRGRRPCRGDRLEPHHLVAGPPLVVVARPHRRACRGRGGSRRLGGPAGSRDLHDHALHRPVAAHRLPAGVSLHGRGALDREAKDPGEGRRGLPKTPARLRRRLTRWRTASTTRRRRWGSSC